MATLSLGSPVDAVAIGDVTGDGRDDVVASTHYDPWGTGSPSDFQLSVFVQQPGGRLAAPLQAPFPGYGMHGENKGIVLVDLDEDGLRDIVLGHGAGIHVFEGAASGGLSGRAVPDASGSVSTLVTLDLNDDDHADIATFDGFQIGIYLGDGRGDLHFAYAFSTSPVALDNINAHMATGDLNGDGHLDFAVYDGTNRAAVFLRTATGAFERWSYDLIPYPASYFTALAVADFDGDGDHDLMLATRVTSRYYPSAKHVLYAQSNGKLAAPVRWDAYDVASAMIGADMDQDGREDLLTVRTPIDVTASVGFSRQVSDGSFAAETRLPLTTPMYSTSPRGLATGDANGDGCRDIAATSGDNVVLFKAQCARELVLSTPSPPLPVGTPAAVPSRAGAPRPDAAVDGALLVRTAERPAGPISGPARDRRESARRPTGREPGF